MQRNSNLDYAEDLTMELEEIEKLIPKEEQVEGASTSTLMCGTYFTLICC